MAAGELDWGEAVLDIRTDQAKLTTGLSDAQKKVTGSVSKMQSSMNTAVVSTDKMAVSLQLMEKAAAASGSRTIAVTKSLVEMGVAARQFAATGLLKVVAGAGAVVASLAAIAALTTAIFARQKIADWIEGLDEANEKLKEQQEILKGQVRTREKLIQGINLQRERIEYGDPYHGMHPAEAAARKALEVARQAEAWEKKGEQISEKNKKTIAQRELAQKKINDALRAEIVLLGDSSKKYEAIFDAEQRALTIKRDKVIAEKAMTAELAAQKQMIAEQNYMRRQQLGLGDTYSTVKQLQQITVDTLGRSLLNERMRRMIPLLPDELQGVARQMFGIRGGGQVGAISPSELGGVQAAKRASGIMFGGKDEQLRLSKMSLAELEKIRIVIEKLVRLEETGGMGAGVP